MSGPHKHHYVPQFYQRGFVPDKSNRIWVYEKGRKPRRCGVKKTGMRIDLYAFRDRDREMDFGSVEHQLAIIDDQAAKVIQKLGSGKALTDRDRVRLSRFVSVMWRRTPKQMIKLNKTAVDLLPEVLEPLDRIAEELTEDARSELERIRREYSVRPPEFLFAQHVLRESEFEKLMYQMDWVFFQAEQGVEFLTSDDPVMFSTGSGLGSADAVIGFPLSRRLFLQCMWKSTYRAAFYPLPSANVEYFNECTTKTAHKQVYASENSDRIQQLVDENLGAWD